MRQNLLSLDAAASCLCLLADSYDTRSTAFNRMQSAHLLCMLLGGRQLDNPDVRSEYFKESAAFFSRILPQVRTMYTGFRYAFSALCCKFG